MSQKILVSSLTVFITFLGAPEAAVNPSACPTGMLGYWSFDDQSNPGNDDYDNYDGTITGKVGWTSSGQVGGALQFDLNGIVDVGAVKPIANSASGGVTYTFWGKPDTQTGTTGMYKSYGYADKQGDVWCSLANTNGQLSIYAMILGGGWEPYYVWQTNVTGNPATYHQVACTYDADQLRVYFDGQLVNTADVTNGITDAANMNPLGIGYQPPLGGPNAQRDKGLIDEAAVFSRALTDQEIAALYNSGLHGFGYCVYTFDGFYAPINNLPMMNTMKAGQAIPLKWRITYSDGNPVTDLTSVNVTASTLSCDLGTTEDLIEEYASGNSDLQNLGNGYYQWNWKTPKSYTRSCKTMTLDLGDQGSVPHHAWFGFSK